MKEVILLVSKIVLYHYQSCHLKTVLKTSVLIAILFEISSTAYIGRFYDRVDTRSAMVVRVAVLDAALYDNFGPVLGQAVLVQTLLGRQSALRQYWSSVG